MSGSDEFRIERSLLNDVLVAIKLTSAFDHDATGLAAMRRVMAFLDDFVAALVTPLDAAAIKGRLSRPIKIPKEFLLKPAAAAEPTAPPRHDRAATRLAALEGG
jgi:hypothetical protein